MNQTSSKPASRINVFAAVEHITLDSDQLLTHAGGDPELMVQLCAAFLSELPLRMEAVDRAIQERGRSTAELALEQLVQCLMLFDSGEVLVTVETLQSAVCSGRVRHIKRERKRLERQLRALVPLVQRLMLETSNPKGTVQ